MLNEERKEYMVGTTGRTTPQKIEIVQNQLTKPLDNLKLEEQLDQEESTMSYSNLVPQKIIRNDKNPLRKIHQWPKNTIRIE